MPVERAMSDIVGIWIAALLTLGIFSFLYKDNLLYKISEAIFVGLSAGFWFVTYFWDNIYKQAWDGIVREHHYYLIVGVILGVLMLMRLVGSIGWIARWPIAFIVGATAGLKLMVFLTTDALAQVHATVSNLGTAHGSYEIVGQTVVAAGTFATLVYFFFSREHKGAFGGAAKCGTWILMITFGASFGYTVMSRMSLLIGRVDFLLTDWLRLIK